MGFLAGFEKARKREAERQRVNPGVLQLIRHLSLVGCAWHYVACAFWVVARVEGFCDPFSDDGSSEETNDGIAAGFIACLDVWAPYVGYQRAFFSAQYSQALRGHQPLGS